MKTTSDTDLARRLAVHLRNPDAARATKIAATLGPAAKSVDDINPLVTESARAHTYYSR